MWLRWLLATVVAVAVIAGVVIAADRAGPNTSTSEAQAEAETNRIADIAVSEDEAPRSSPLPRGLPQAVALERAIGRDARQRVEGGQLTGPLQGVSCQASGPGVSGRTPYRCAVRSRYLSYPFLAVADEATGQLVWCKVDEPATPHAGPEIQISPRCRA